MMLRVYRRTGKFVLTALIAGIFIAGSAYAIPDRVKGTIAGITVSPTDIAITNDDRWLFVAGGNTINVVDTATFEATASISASSEVRSIAVNSTDNYLYVLQKDGNLALVSLNNLDGAGPGEAVSLPSPSWNDVTDGKEPADMVVGAYPGDSTEQYAFVTIPAIREIRAFRQTDLIDGNISPQTLSAGSSVLAYSNDPRDVNNRLLFSASGPDSSAAVSVYGVNNSTFEMVYYFSPPWWNTTDAVDGMSASPAGSVLAVTNVTKQTLDILVSNINDNVLSFTPAGSISLGATPKAAAYYEDKNGSGYIYTATDDGNDSALEVVDLLNPANTVNRIDLGSIAATGVASSSSEDGYLYVTSDTTTPGQVQVISANPWIYDVSPSSSVNRGGVTEVTFKTDEGVKYWVSVGGTIDKNSGTKIFSSDTVTTEPDINNTFTIDGDQLTEGSNNIYIFVEDADGNVGRRGFILEKNLAPEAPTFRLGFGDSTIYVFIEALDVDDIEYYQIFYSPDINDLSDPPSSPSEKVYSFTKGEEFKHLIKGVQNGTTYYVMVRAVDSDGNEGVLSAIKPIMPQETESLVERTGESGGCAAAYPGDDVSPAGVAALLSLWMVIIIVLRKRFGHKGGNT